MSCGNLSNTSLTHPGTAADQPGDTPADRSTGEGILVLGLGNDILTDDAVGLVLARELRRRLADESGVDVRETSEMGLALLDMISGYDSVLLVDSIQTGRAKPGFLHELDPGQFRTLSGATPHFLGIQETLVLGRQLGLPMPTKVRVYGIEVEDPFTLSMQLTAALQSALPRILESIEQGVRLQLAAGGSR